MGLTTLWKLRRRAINLLETSVQSHLKLPESKRNLIKCQQSHSCILRHFLNFYSVLSRSVVSDSLWPHGLLLCSWNFADKNTAAGCHFLLQGIFLLWESSPSPVSPALAGGFFTTEPPRKPLCRAEGQAREEAPYNLIKS